MLNSMTAYGRAVVLSPVGRLIVEISSVNRKHLEVLTALPSALQRFEVDVKKWVCSAIRRGRVAVNIQISYEDGANPIQLRVNSDLARALVEAGREIEHATGLSALQIPIEQIMRWDGVIQQQQEIEDTQPFELALKEAVTQALSPFLEMRQREGESLKQDILKRIRHLHRLTDQVTAACEGATDQYREKLTERLDSLLSEALSHDERILREVALVAERADITEEITRIRSHLEQLETLVRSDEAAVGKSLDFLLQELFREANTMAAKSATVEISHLAVEVKSELERIREQVQNVE